MSVNITDASSGDLEQIKFLLALADLPTEGVDDHIETFLVARESDQVVGSIGLELYGEVALLRSAVVVKERQNVGIGTALYDSIVDVAKKHGVKKLVLLTNTAEKYFARKGFLIVDRNSVQGPVTRSVEFSGACPSHAFCMEMDL